MSYPTSIKVEKAITIDYLPNALAIVGLNIYEGHSLVPKIALPNLVIYAEGSSPHSDFPVEVGVRVVRLRCKFTVFSGNNEAEQLAAVANRNTWKEKLETAMVDNLPTLQAALNKPVGADNRTVKKIHFHYVTMADDPSDRTQTDHIEDLIFDVICEPLDA